MNSVAQSMADDGSPSSEETSSSQSQPEVMRNNKEYTPMLPETAALLVFNRYLLSAYSPTTPNAPPAISPLAIATPHMIRSWLNGVLLLFNYNVALRRNDDGVFNNLLNLSTQETRPERSDAQFHQSNHFKEFTRQPISSTPTSSQSGVSSRVSKGKLQLRMPRESRDSGVGSSAMNEASRPRIGLVFIQRRLSDERSRRREYGMTSDLGLNLKLKMDFL
ncbi:hypothetical protein Aperf_G00000013667 [Anoplocephala perfoliata]